MEYRGWTVTEFKFHGKPHWQAMQFGVCMNTNSADGIKRMIDQSIALKQIENDRRRAEA